MLGHIWISNDFNVILHRNRKIHHGVVSHIHRVVNSHGILCPLLGSMSGPIEMIHQQTATDYTKAPNHSQNAGTVVAKSENQLTGC